MDIKRMTSDFSIHGDYDGKTFICVFHPHNVTLLDNLLPYSQN